MQKTLSRLVGWRLQYVLVIGFVLTAAITIAVGTPITNSVIENYLEGAQDSRVGRDMDLAEAFYEIKLRDISSTARRIAVGRSLGRALATASPGQGQELGVVKEAISTETSILAPDAQRFIVVTDAKGISVAGEVVHDGQHQTAATGVDWRRLPIVEGLLADGQARTGTEVVPGDVLAWVDLDQQAQIRLLDTPKAAPAPFDPREGTAGLALVSVAPAATEQGQLVGAVLVGHLFNNDFTLVDRIKEVAGVDTVTIFFGDLRVSTNVLDEYGGRAIGTRVSQEVFDQVLVRGEEFTGPAYVVNQWYITRYRPLYDHQDQVVGSLYVGARRSTFERLLDSFRRQSFLIAGSTILLAILIAIPLGWSISRPLTELAAATRRVSGGDWSVRVPVYGRGEVGVLAESFNAMVGTLQETQEQLVQKEKLASVGQLAAGVAHEINNPLGSVLLYADILFKETPEENAQQREDLQMIIREATRCKTIVNDLLNFSRESEVLAQETDLNSLLREMIEETSKMELFRDVRVVANLDPSLPPIQADPLQLRQVFLNLMNNAAEAMPEGGELTLRTHRGPMPGTVTAKVEDTGIGIPEQNMKKIFTPFFTTKPIGRGTGLGLAIIYGIVKMHRGQITLQSEVGKGTTFTIVLREKLPAQAQQLDDSLLLE